MSTKDAKYAERVMKRVEDRAQEYRDAQPSDQPLGSHGVTDEMIAAFMEQKDAEQPGYIRALGFVDGGLDWLKAFERARGLR